MFRKNNTNEQTSLFSRQDKWSNYMKRRVKKTWVSFYHDNIFPIIDEGPYKVLFSDNEATCPNVPINILVSLSIFKSLLNMSDEEVIDALMFDDRIKYAVHTLDLAKQPGSENILNLFRRRICAYEAETGINLFDNTMREINDKLVEMSGVKKNVKRIDSMMISSSCKKLNRIELVYEVNKIFVKKVIEMDYSVGKLKTYADAKNKTEVLYKTKTTEENNKLYQLLNDSIKLYKKFKNNPKVNELKEFKTLKRLINEQYDINNKKPRSNKEIKPIYMQTPYDEDATYRFKYGHNVGYTANIEEAMIEKGGAIVTDYDVDKNVVSDKEFLERHINKKENDEEETVIVDSAYYSDELEKEANKSNIKIHPTELVGKKVKDDLLYAFEIDEKNNKIVTCPNNQKPIEQIMSVDEKTMIAYFDRDMCINCNKKDKCPINILKTMANIRTKVSTVNRAKQNHKRKEPNYIEISNKRAGIEGIPSVLRRRYHIDNRGGKGLMRLKMTFSTSIISINLKRMVKITNEKPKKA